MPAPYPYVMCPHCHNRVKSFQGHITIHSFTERRPNSTLVETKTCPGSGKTV